MAKCVDDIRGKIVGRYGDGVGYLWKGKQCFRAYVAHIAYPDTPSQKSERDWFVSMVRFASKATAALKLGFRESAEQAQMSEGNYFVRRNKPFFHHKDGALSVDYQSLVIAEGEASDVYFDKPVFEEKEIVEVAFERNSRLLRPAGDDKVYVYFYNADLEEGYLAAPVLRRSKKVRVQLPEQWASCEVHVYGFVVDRMGRASNSTYIGVGRVNYMADNGQFVPINKGWKDFVDLAEYSYGSTRQEGHEDAEKPRDGSSVFTPPSPGVP